ncbi:MAG TPA: glycogen phosphorylase [Rhodospirillaceae bacterium]|nr:MAG: glycogen phosphorylase [Alphaproteobacteria bacterium GWF2_58_20]HAU29246.1 glycogen phosphorylase [Rhodospirillaceae bacterium]
MDEMSDVAPAFTSVADLKQELLRTMSQVVGKDPQYATAEDWYYALAFLIRGMLSERYINSGQAQRQKAVKRVFYLSMEYLPGRMLMKQLIDIGMLDCARQAISELGQDITKIAETEMDPALGNGGLGRLASCILDSMATHGYPGFGYGIRYQYGMFKQEIEGGQQVEKPENWLRDGNPWEFPRPKVMYTIRFHGKVISFKDEKGRQTHKWVDSTDVLAQAYDLPICGHGADIVNNIRLWGAEASTDLNLRQFNEGNYFEAVKEKTASENLSKVLYPNDATMMGLELRLKQEYFFASASIQDILARFLRRNKELDMLPDKVTIQLNDTHPCLAIPEFMRVLIDHYGYEWDKAWDITTRVFNYTNHTLLPEALEHWPISMLDSVLPRHMMIIYEINQHFLHDVRKKMPGDGAVLPRLSLIDDASRKVRMANLAIVGSRRVNGVAELHTHLLKTSTFSDFNRLFPEKFVNVTNGITQRRWLLQSNPGLSEAISDRIGKGWITDLSQLEQLVPFADDPEFRKQVMDIKLANKKRLTDLIQRKVGIEVQPETLFDAQVKRIHEYKRQLLNMLHVITRYNHIRAGQADGMQARTIVMAGKAAPGYFMAKLIIRLINDVAEIVNNDLAAHNLLKLVFIPNYNVTSAEIIIPGSDLSEQISTAGTEASGTGNMKFALSGALTIGTLDGANIEIRNQVGEDNIFIFGMDANEAHELRLSGYNPRQKYDEDAELRKAVDMIASGYFSPDDPGRYRPLVDALLGGGDTYLLLADYRSYIAAQKKVDDAFQNPETWARMSILNIAHMGMFSSDRTVHEYAHNIWNVESITTRS